METVKACTTVGGHSPVHTSPWLPSGLTCVWALSIPHSLNTSAQTHTHTQHMQSQGHTNRSACPANADRCADSVNKILTQRFHAHMLTPTQTYTHARLPAGKQIWQTHQVTCGTGAFCCWSCWSCKIPCLFPHNLLLSFSFFGTFCVQITCQTCVCLCSQI